MSMHPIQTLVSFFTSLFPIPFIFKRGIDMSYCPIIKDECKEMECVFSDMYGYCMFAKYLAYKTNSFEG